MAFSTASHPSSGVDVTNYKATHKPISDAIKSFGFVKTTDSGQVLDDWSNVTTAPATTVVRDYEIYKFGDTLQTTSPVFFRVDYMHNSNVPRLDFTFGTGSNGAGVITGSLGTITLVASVAGASTTSFTSYFCGANNRLVMMLWKNHSNSQMTYLFSIERTHNDDGTDKADEIDVAWGTSSSASGKQQVFSPSGNGEQLTGYAMRYIIGATTGVRGTKAGGFSTAPILGLELNPRRNFFLFFKANITDLTTVPLAVYQTAAPASPNYIAMGGTNWNQIIGSITGMGILMRWE